MKAMVLPEPGPIDRSPLYTHTEEFPLEAANEALQRLKHDQINGAAVLRVS